MNRTFGSEFLVGIEPTQYGCGCGDPSFWDGVDKIHPDDFGLFDPTQIPPHLLPAPSAQ